MEIQPFLDELISLYGPHCTIEELDQGDDVVVLATVRPLSATDRPDGPGYSVGAAYSKVHGATARKLTIFAVAFAALGKDARVRFQEMGGVLRT
jgi:hypothetical protein